VYEEEALYLLLNVNDISSIVCQASVTVKSTVVMRNVIQWKLSMANGEENPSAESCNQSKWQSMAIFNENEEEMAA